jgi:hypothetical protein
MEKPQILSDEEIAEVLRKSFPDSPTTSLNTINPRILMLCREVAQAQLQKILKRRRNERRRT